MRIVGGSFRGRTILAPPGRSVRPTSEKARQAIFNILEHHDFDLDFSLESARVIDLFAGSGALGLEALSRGAAHALFVETDTEAAQLVQKNIDALGLTSNARVLRRNATRLTSRSATDGSPFDLAFLDAPYGSRLTELALNSLREGGWLAPDALLVVESAKREQFAAPAGFKLLDERTYGAACIRLLRLAEF